MVFGDHDVIMSSGKQNRYSILYKLVKATPHPYTTRLKERSFSLAPYLTFADHLLEAKASVASKRSLETLKDQRWKDVR